jgi:hypothetical protein
MKLESTLTKSLMRKKLDSDSQNLDPKVDQDSIEIVAVIEETEETEGVDLLVVISNRVMSRFRNVKHVIKNKLK